MAPGQLLRSRQWDGEFVVYNDLSGDTHLVDSAAMALLLLLQARAGDAAGVAWPEEHAHNASAEQAGEIDDALATLASAYLIECVAC